MKKHSPSSVRLHNLDLVLKTIILNEPLSRADIVRITGISKPTVSNLVEDLIKKGIVSEVGTGKSRGGRKPILLKFNSTKKYLLAFEMGRSGYKIAISDLKGKILAKKNDEFTSDKVLNERLNILKNEIDTLLEKNNLQIKEILKVICIGPGVYTERGKELRWLPYNGKDEQADIKSFFSNYFKKNIIVNHSTKLSLLGEKAMGKARGYRNVVYVDFAYGLGSAIMIDGGIYFGSNNSAGEMGYFYSDIEEFKKYRIKPYQFGALENHLSGKALREKGIQLVKNHKNSLILKLANFNPENISAKIIFQAAMQNDSLALKILYESFEYFNMALANIINLITPELVIFGGGFSNAGNFLLGFIEKSLKEKVLIMPELEISDLKNDASIIGGIQYLIYNTNYLEEL